MFEDKVQKVANEPKGKDVLNDYNKKTARYEASSFVIYYFTGAMFDDA
jgi:hypothetical protein